MSRFLPITLLVFLLASFSIFSAAEDRRPNILLVVADDMGFTDLGSFGGEISTPNIDELAKSGIKFTDFHVSVSCSPTRAMLLTGNDNHIAGLGNMAELLTDEQKGKPGYEGHLNNRVVTLAEVLRDSGYHTYMAGKWHLGHSEGTLPFDRGFDRSFSMLVGGASHYGDMLGILPRDDPAAYSKNGKHLDQLPADHYSSRSFSDYLIESIRSNQADGKPFFAYLAFQAPHDPVQVPEPWLSKYRGQYDEGYEVLRDERWKSAKEKGIIPKDAELAPPSPLMKPWKQLSGEERALEARGMEVYAGMLDAMDYHFGRVVNFLKDIGEYENTIIVFLSDNGANPWYSEEYPEAKDPKFTAQFDSSVERIGHPRSNYAYGIGFASASGGPLDKFKMTVGQGGIRVPMLIAGPGIQDGKKNDAFIYVTDVMPTLLELAGAEYPSVYDGRSVESMSGRSFANVLSGKATSVYSPTEFIGGEMSGGKWVRQGDFKAVLVPKPYGEGEWRLYNVVDDPGETKDLSKEIPEKLALFIEAWKKYAREVGVVPSVDETD